MNRNLVSSLALFGLGLTILILNIDLTIVTVALPIIGRFFQASMTQLQWVNNVYLLVFASTVILVGKISDIVGAKKVFCSGIVIFFLGSAIAGFAPNIPLLIIGRIFQGIGMAQSFPMAIILANRIFPPEKRSVAIGILITFTGVGQAIGPTIGGFITQFASWRYVFLVNLPICVVCCLLVFYFCSRDEITLKEKYVDYFSAIILALALILYLFAFNEINHWGVGSGLFISCLAIATVLMGLFIILQKRCPYPLVDLSIFNQSSFSLICVVRLLFQYTFVALIFVLPLYLQNILQFEPSHVGLILLTSTVVMGIVGPITGKAVTRFGVRKLIIISQFASVLGYLLFLFSGDTISWVTFLLGLMLIGVNVGVMFSASNYAAVNVVAPQQQGVGYGVFITIAFFSGAIGVGLSGAMLSAIGLHHFTQTVAAQHMNLSSQLFEPVISGAHNISYVKKIVSPDLVPIVSGWVKSSFVVAYHDVIAIMLILSLVALIISFFLREPKS